MEPRSHKIFGPVNGNEIGITVEGVFLTADSISNEQIATLGPKVFSGFENHCGLLRSAMQEETIAAMDEAIATGDLDKLRGVAGRMKGFGAQLAAWNERLGQATTRKLRELEHGFAADSDLIREQIRLAEQHPEQSDSADDWWRK